MIQELLLYKNIFEFAKEGFFLTNNRGIIELVNPKMVKLFGYTLAEDLVGKPVEVLIPDSFAKKHVAYRKEFINNPIKRTMGAGTVLKGKKRNGDLFNVEISLSNFNDQDNEMKILGFVVDVTERVKADEQIKRNKIDLERKVRERTNELEEALEKGKELSDLKTRFVSMVSHEFRTPMSSIFSSATLLSKYQKEDQQPNRDKHIKRIKSSVLNLTAIINDILTLNKTEEGKIEINLCQINLPELFNETCEELQAISKRNQKIKYTHTGSLYFNTDIKLIKNMAVNLISNAIKYSKDGGSIDIITILKNNFLLIKVIDFGIGIPLDEQEKIFVRFFRAKNVTNIQGTGLGLNIVKKYTELLNGRISFESSPGVKTEFVVELPNGVI